MVIEQRVNVSRAVVVFAALLVVGLLGALLLLGSLGWSGPEGQGHPLQVNSVFAEASPSGQAEIPPARVMTIAAEVQETFESDTVGQRPANWGVVNSPPPINYDADWQVVDLGAPFGKVVSATTVFDTSAGSYLSHLAYLGTTLSITNGEIPKQSHYYVETLLYMVEDVNYYADEHTLQGIVQSGYNLEVLIWSPNDGAQWALRLYSNGGEGRIADWGTQNNGITASTGQTGWGWWGRVGMDVNLPTGEVEVFFNGQSVIGPLVVDSIAGIALASGEPIRADVRSTNNLMYADDFRIYLPSITPVKKSRWGFLKKLFGALHQTGILPLLS